MSNAVHDVFNEGILDEENANVNADADEDATRALPLASVDVNDVEMMEAANRKIEELSSVCTAQDSEVSVVGDVE